MSSEDISGFKRLIWIFYVVLHQFVAIIAGYVISFTFNGNLDQLWLWHEVLTPIGVVFIMFEGVLAFSPYNHLTSDIKKITLNNIHGYFMALGLTLMTVGVSFAYASNDTHFKTLHGIFGLVAWILCVISGVGGILTRYAFSLKDQIRPIYLRFCHTLLGLTAFLAALVTASLGLYKQIDDKPTLVPIVITMIVLVGLATLLKAGKTVIGHTLNVFSS